MCAVTLRQPRSGASRVVPARKVAMPGLSSRVTPRCVEIPHATELDVRDQGGRRSRATACEVWRCQGALTLGALERAVFLHCSGGSQAECG